LSKEYPDKGEEGKGKTSAAETIVLQIKEIGAKVEQLGHSFEDVQSLDKSIKNIVSVLDGLDTRVKGLNELVNAVVRSTRELSEDIKSNTALMNMLMRALETKSMERENTLLKNIEMSTDLIERFTSLIKAQTETSSDEK
jgi:uncharacterized protein YoxC